MSDKRPVGVFDSGLGGLTVLRALRRELPHEDIVYFGDTGRVPYGTKSAGTIERYAIEDEDFLLSKNVKMIIAACGTVSSVAYHTGERLDIPFMGVVVPAAHEAVKRTENGIIGVIGTSATVKSGAYERELKALSPECRVISKACPLFVPIVEEGITQSNPELAFSAARYYLDSFENTGIDTLILGCTHYPIIKDIVASVMPGVNLIDIGSATAKQAAEIMKKYGILSDSEKEGKCKYYVSDETSGFARQARLFLGEDLKSDVEHVELE